MSEDAAAHAVEAEVSRALAELRRDRERVYYDGECREPVFSPRIGARWHPESAHTN
jgi:hypothetical protein